MGRLARSPGRGHTLKVSATSGVAMDVAVRDLKDRLSEYLRRAQAGEEIVVTSHGRPIVRMTGVAEVPGAETEADVIARLRALPWVRPGNGERLEPVANPIPAGPPGEALLSELLLKDRE